MKKIISCTAALVTAVTITGNVAYAVKNYTVNDLKGLSDYILGKAGTAEDVNNDGAVDVFDLIEMRKAFSDSGELTESLIPASEENVKFTGRNYCDKEGVTWLVQSGSAVEFNVSAESAEVTIYGDENINSDEKYRPRYAVIVDGEIILDEVMSEKEKTVELFSGKENRTAEVKIIHLSEANNGTVGVGDIKVNSTASIPVSPLPEKDLLIEFIGDSITCAYGVEGTSAYENFMTSTENFMKSYAYLTAQKLNADYSAVCYSGHGIVSGYTQDGSINTDSLVPDVYEQIGKIKPYDVAWNFKRKPDVIVINLGTNDNTYVSAKDTEKRSEEYIKAYTDFLRNIYAENPDAHIICTLGTMGCQELYPCIETAVERFKAVYHTDNISCYMSAVQDMNEGLGSDWHPNAINQQKSAYVLADKICQALGIESDMIGLDVASDAKYSLEKADNVNVSDYFSDYDKSYHITTVTGGDDINSIKAHVSGIKLKKDGEYDLSFAIDTAKGQKIPFSLIGSDGTVYCEAVFTGTGEKSVFSDKFTSSVNDDSAELVFCMGGTDNLRASLYDVKMVKVK
ncbi:MAG: carbohydrate binding domain-containing protein [Ruminococcus sp.]|nr:carbohydrate binding domain-containing protein [Ruminococcus sp.]